MVDHRAGRDGQRQDRRCRRRFGRGREHARGRIGGDSAQFEARRAVEKQRQRIALAIEGVGHRGLPVDHQARLVGVNPGAHAHPFGDRSRGRGGRGLLRGLRPVFRLGGFRRRARRRLVEEIDHHRRVVAERPEAEVAGERERHRPAISAGRGVLEVAPQNPKRLGVVRLDLALEGDHQPAALDFRPVRDRLAPGEDDSAVIGMGADANRNRIGERRPEGGRRQHGPERGADQHFPRGSRPSSGACVARHANRLSLFPAGRASAGRAGAKTPRPGGESSARRFRPPPVLYLAPLLSAGAEKQRVYFFLGFGDGLELRPMEKIRIGDELLRPAVRGFCFG